MDRFTPSNAPVKRVKTLQFGVLDPDFIVCQWWCIAMTLHGLHQRGNAHIPKHMHHTNTLVPHSVVTRLPTLISPSAMTRDDQSWVGQLIHASGCSIAAPNAPPMAQVHRIALATLDTLSLPSPCFTLVLSRRWSKFYDVSAGTPPSSLYQGYVCLDGWG